MKYILLLLTILQLFPLVAQDTLSEQQVNRFTTSFTIQNGVLQGEGADQLQKEFHAAQFVLLGETHEDAQIAQFTQSILPDLRREGFQHFITENGNHELQIMLESVTQSTDAIRALHQFYSEGYQLLGEHFLPFFGGKEDALFLEEALQQGFQFHGIDQAYFCSFPLLINRLKDLSKKSDSLTRVHEMAIQFLLKEYEKERSQKTYPLSENLLKSEEIKSFFQLLDLQNKEVVSIINSLKESWEIYALHRTNRAENFQRRGKWMKQQLFNHYHHLENTSSEAPKMLIKLGAMHTMRGVTPLGIEDVGEEVNRFAKQNGVKDLNLLFLFRYYLDEEETLGYFDNSEGESKWLKERRVFMRQGRLKEWRMINLSKLHEFIQQNKLYVHEPLQRMINQHDFILIPPATRDVQPNYLTNNP